MRNKGAVHDDGFDRCCCGECFSIITRKSSSKKFSDWKNWKSQTAQFLLGARLFFCEAVLTPHFIKGVWLPYTHICMCAVLESVNSAILRKVKTMTFKELDFWKKIFSLMSLILKIA